jgi:hypothetical protein
MCALRVTWSTSVVTSKSSAWEATGRMPTPASPPRSPRVVGTAGRSATVATDADPGVAEFEYVDPVGGPSSGTSVGEPYDAGRDTSGSSPRWRRAANAGSVRMPRRLRRDGVNEIAVVPAPKVRSAHAHSILRSSVLVASTSTTTDRPSGTSSSGSKAGGRVTSGGRIMCFDRTGGRSGSGVADSPHASGGPAGVPRQGCGG